MTKLGQAEQSFDADASTAARIRRAEDAIANLKANFAKWVKGDIEAIVQNLASAQVASDPCTLSDCLEALRRVAHNIKGQGGTFGCDGLSQAAGALDSYIKRNGTGADLAITAGLVNELQAAYQRELSYTRN